MSGRSALEAELAAIVGREHVRVGDGLATYLHDATEVRGLRGRAEAAVLPGGTEEVAALLRWASRSGVPVVPRGGGTGYAGGAVPDGGVVLGLERLTRVRSLEPLLWRGEVEAGVTTERVRRLARENGLLFPPDPGAAEQSQLGGNIATNAGGPHAFKYGVTGAWVTGLEAVLMGGEAIRMGGHVRKDVAGYDLRSLLIGSEGTLAVITGAHIRFIPAPEAALPVIGVYDGTAAGCAAVGACLASDAVPSAIEYLDRGAIQIVRGAFPGELPADAGFVVIAEADGSRSAAEADRRALYEAMSDGALALLAPEDPHEVEALWRWRDGVGLAADAALGGKVSEDIVVPIDGLEEAVEGTREIAARHELASCSWGHAGDGNLHSTFLFARADDAAARRASPAAEELFGLAVALGGTVSGEHGLGVVKSGQLSRQWSPAAVGLHQGVKRLFDGQGLLNPGKKVP